MKRPEEERMRNSIPRGIEGVQTTSLTQMTVAVALCLTCLVVPAAYANPAGEVGFQPGVVNSGTRPLTANQLDALAEGIRRWTGFEEVYFDLQGRLRIGSTFRGGSGSAAARVLIVAAVNSGDAFRLEDHDRSMAVAFASIQPVEEYVDGAEVSHTIWSVRLDFHDFRQLRGSPAGLAAFDPAISFLHELGHGVMHLRDSISASDPLGDCERYMNKIRREAGRAERQSYRPRLYMGSTLDYPDTSVHAQLTFVRRSTGAKAKVDLVSFRLASVGVSTTVRRGSGTNY